MTVCDETEFLPTRQSLIERLKNLEDQETWREFFELYWKLIFGVTIKSGFSHEEAQDVVQETIISVSKSIHRFRADPAFGSFKSWLLTITFRKMKDLRRKGLRNQRPSDEVSLTSGGDSESIEESAPSNELEILWDAEWNEAVRRAALEKLKRLIPPKQFQVFFLHVIKEVPASEAAQIAGTSVAQIYLLKHRLIRRYKTCLELAESQLTN